MGVQEETLSSSVDKETSLTPEFPVEITDCIVGMRESSILVVERVVSSCDNGGSRVTFGVTVTSAGCVPHARY